MNRSTPPESQEKQTPTDPADEKIAARLARIRHTLIVLSGKGGVGKSTVAVNLALGLAAQGRSVGLLDADLNGPSVPTLLGLQHEKALMENNEIIPVAIGTLKVMSIGFFLASREDAVIWRGPRKMAALRQLLQDVAWGDLDYLVVDSPPGTGDEPLSLSQMLHQADGALIVTTPQPVAIADVRRSITFCRSLKMPIVGLIENMSGWACPHCGEVTPVFEPQGGQRLAEENQIPWLGTLPLDPRIAASGDAGRGFALADPETPAAKKFTQMIEKIIHACESKTADVSLPDVGSSPEGLTMERVAIPIAGGQLCSHFGHCEAFALLDVDVNTRQVMQRRDLVPPPHEPGVLPRWLTEQGAQVVLAGGMGQRAQALFAEQGIRVIVGVEPGEPEAVVADYLAGVLKTGMNRCDH